MENKRDVIEMIEKHPEEITLRSDVTDRARARIRELYGNGEAVEQKKNFANWFALFPLTMLIAIIIALVVVNTTQPRFLNVEEVSTTPIQSIQQYNTENNTEYLYLNIENAETNTNIAVDKVDNSFAYLKQSIFVFDEVTFDVVDFYVSPSNVICKDFEKHDKIENMQQYAGVDLYFTEKLGEDGFYMTNARFEYNGAKYYFTIQSFSEGVIFNYVDLLFAK